MNPTYRLAQPQKTTDLDIVRLRPNRFVWGKVVEIFEIGRYTLVEYKSKDDQGAASEFYVYVDGKATSRSGTSLELGLLIAMAIGANGSTNSDAGIYAARVLGVKP